MTPEARAFLNSLDDLCLKRDQTSKDVMAVLTALRAPDHNNEGHLKSVATIPIRRAALPGCAAAADAAANDPRASCMVVRGESAMRMVLDDPSDDGRVDLRSVNRDFGRRPTAMSTAEYHWSQHASEAAKALGLRLIK